MYIADFALALLTPLSLFCVGLFWRLSPPKNRDQLLSYRTNLSLKTEATWIFAHQHISKLWIRIGVILSIITIILMVALKDSYELFILWLIGGQMIFLCGSVFFVDSIMKVVFDEDGNNVL